MTTNADETRDGDMFGLTAAGALGLFTVCLACGALLADGDGAKNLHRQMHEATDVER